MKCIIDYEVFIFKCIEEKIFVLIKSFLFAISSKDSKINDFQTMEQFLDMLITGLILII